MDLILTKMDLSWTETQREQKMTSKTQNPELSWIKTKPSNFEAWKTKSQKNNKHRLKQNSFYTNVTLGNIGRQEYDSGENIEEEAGVRQSLTLKQQQNHMADKHMVG